MAYTLRIDNKKAAFVSFKAAMHRMSSSGRQSRPASCEALRRMLPEPRRFRQCDQDWSFFLDAHSRINSSEASC